MTKQLTDT